MKAAGRGRAPLPPAPPAPTAKPIAPARSAAFAILLEIDAGRGHSDELLQTSAVHRLSGLDRNLATALVMGVLRAQIALDAALLPLFARPDQTVHPAVRTALRMGAFQLLHMDRIPVHAALSESVELCRAAGQPHATGMVNAILRKLASAPKPGRKLYEPTAAFATRLGHPAWLVERWVSNFGREAALAICETGQREPEATSALFAEVSGAPLAGEGVPGSDPADAELEGAPPATMPRMDAGSRLVAELTAAAAPYREDGRLQVWDCCAAPGGKTMVLAQRLPGAAILASDISRRRLGSMEQRLGWASASHAIEFLVADALALAPELGDFDLILCDVPCTGTGTLARNPEIRHRLQPAEIERQAERQGHLLTAALGRLRPGGRLVYSTCSLEPEECERVVVESGLSAGGVRLLPVEALLEDLSSRGILSAVPRDVTRDGTLRTLPGVHPCDGFYAAVLERRA